MFSSYLYFTNEVRVELGSCMLLHTFFNSCSWLTTIRCICFHTDILSYLYWQTTQETSCFSTSFSMKSFFYFSFLYKNWSIARFTGLKAYCYHELFSWGQLFLLVERDLLFFRTSFSGLDFTKSWISGELCLSCSWL